MARVVRFHEIGGPEVLRIEDVEVSPPGKGELQIRIRALGLNRAEAMFRRGQYLEEPKLPARLGYEAAGTVPAIGRGVDGFQIGEAVSTIPSFSLNAYGLYGDLANAPVHAVTHHPTSLSRVEAAAIWMQCLTAYGALIDIADLKSGETVVIPAASSSVGLAAIQIANKVGAIDGNHGRSQTFGKRQGTQKPLLIEKETRAGIAIRGASVNHDMTRRLDQRQCANRLPGVVDYRDV